MEKRSKSLAIKKIWVSEEADIYSYMDADISTDISHMRELISGIEEGNDIVTGSRTSKKSQTSRNFKRHFISLTLIFILRLLFSLKMTDFQCGFKAINRKFRDKELPKMKAVNHGFMDAEMLIVAHNKGYKIKEIPVLWKDDRKSKIKILAGITDALKNMLKIRIDLLRGTYD